MAITINFELTGLREIALVKVATANNMTPEEYAQNVIMSFLEERVRGYYQDKFNSLTTVQMIQLFGDMV